MIISYNRNNHTKKGTKNYSWNVLVIYTGTAQHTSNFKSYAKGARTKSLNH